RRRGALSPGIELATDGETPEETNTPTKSAGTPLKNMLRGWFSRTGLVNEKCRAPPCNSVGVPPTAAGDTAVASRVAAPDRKRPGPPVLPVSWLPDAYKSPVM